MAKSRTAKAWAWAAFVLLMVSLVSPFLGIWLDGRWFWTGAFAFGLFMLFADVADRTEKRHNERNRP